MFIDFQNFRGNLCEMRGGSDPMSDVLGSNEQGTYMHYIHIYKLNIYIYI